MPNKLLKIFLVVLATTFLTGTIYAADITPPSTTYTQTPSSPDGNNDWYVTPITFDIQATDLESGVKEINYRIDSGTWQKVEFSNTLNLAPNPSFEIANPASSTGIQDWEASIIDGQAVYSQDTTTSLPGYESAAAKIAASAGTWHGINNKNVYAVTFPYENMSASVWVKSPSVTGQTGFKIYAIGSDSSEEVIAQSSTVVGQAGWVKLSIDFSVTKENAIGVYMDIGIIGDGDVWIDAVELNSSSVTPGTQVIISSDNADHRMEFYSVDFIGNIESYSCTSPTKNCIDFKLDTTTPGNWYDSGATRSQGAEHELWIYTNVQDATSGLSTLSDRYQYHTSTAEGFGYYEDLLGCNSTWNIDLWTTLSQAPLSDGITNALLQTQKTDLCDSNWQICKTVKFYAEDMAGNFTEKEFCIKGPWIRVRGGGIVRVNNNIDMIAEPVEDNTDGLIETMGNSVNFFTSSANWKRTNAPSIKGYDYDTLWNTVSTKTDITGQGLPTTSGTFYTDGDFTITNQNVPNSYDNDTFTQVIFINGNLTFERNIAIDPTSAVLYVVKGDVHIEEAVDLIESALFSDGIFYTAYDIVEGESSKTLELRGVFMANSFALQRTLQAAGNDSYPSEDIVYEPKYLVKLKDFFGNSSVTWLGQD